MKLPTGAECGNEKTGQPYDTTEDKTYNGDQVHGNQGFINKVIYLVLVIDS